MGDVTETMREAREYISDKAAEAIHEQAALQSIRKIMKETGISVDRLRELAEADIDGRCEIHPVKDGEFVYSIFAYANGLSPKKSNGEPFEDIAVYKVNDFTRNTVDREFGKTVFRTYDEAKSALEKIKEDKQ